MGPDFSGGNLPGFEPPSVLTPSFTDPSQWNPDRPPDEILPGNLGRWGDIVRPLPPQYQPAAPAFPNFQPNSRAGAGEYNAALSDALTRTYKPTAVAPIEGTPEASVVDTPNTVRVDFDWQTFINTVKRELQTSDTPPSGSQMWKPDPNRPLLTQMDALAVQQFPDKAPHLGADIWNTVTGVPQKLIDEIGKPLAGGIGLAAQRGAEALVNPYRAVGGENPMHYAALQVADARAAELRAQGLNPFDAARIAAREIWDQVGVAGDQPNASNYGITEPVPGFKAAAELLPFAGGEAAGALASKIPKVGSALGPLVSSTVSNMGLPGTGEAAGAVVGTAARGVGAGAKAIASTRFATEEAGLGKPNLGLDVLATKLRAWVDSQGPRLDPANRNIGNQAAKRIVQMGEQPGVVTKGVQPASLAGGGTAKLGFQNETFTNPETQQVLAGAKDAMAAELGAKTAPITHAETQAAASMLGVPPEIVARRLAKRGTLSRDITAVAQGIEEKLAVTDAVAIKGGLNLSINDRIDALVAAKEASVMLAQFSEGSSELGRALNARKIAIERAKAENPPEQAYRKALELLGILKPDDADKVLGQLVAARGDFPATMKILRDLNKMSWGDYLGTFFRGNILWSVTTQSVNLFSNEIQKSLLLGRMLVEPAVQTGLSLGSKTALAIGKPGAKPYEVTRLYSDVLPYAQGYLKGEGRAWKRIFEVVTRQKAIDEYGAKHGGEMIPLGRSAPVKTVFQGLLDVATVPFKGLTMADWLTTMPVYAGELERLASKQATKEGLKGVAHGARKAELLLNPPLDIHTAATNLAEDVALHSKGARLTAFNNLVKEVPVLGYIMPFTTTPTNIVGIGLRHTPLGLTRLVTQRGRGNAAQVITESGVMASAMFGYFWSEMESGNMTGTRPVSKAEQDLWQAEGLGPLMVRADRVPVVGALQHLLHPSDFDKRWVGGYIYGPAMIPMLLAAAIRDAHSDSSVPADKQVTAVFKAMVQTFAQQLPMLQGVQTVDKALTDPFGTVGNIGVGIAKGFIPASAMLGMVERMTDDYKRNPDGLGQTLQATIPWLAQHGVDVAGLQLPPVPEQLDVLGFPVPNISGLEGALPRGTTQKGNPVVDEGQRLIKVDPTAGLSRMPTSIGTQSRKIDLSTDQQYRLQQLGGQAQNEALTKLLADPKYQQATDPEKVTMWKKARDTARDAGLKGFGIELAKTAKPSDRNVMTLQKGTSDELVPLGTRIALGAANNNREKANVVAALKDVLTPTYEQLVDSFRNPTDLSVADLKTGKQLMDAYDAAPPWRVARMEQMQQLGVTTQQVDDAIATYRKLVSEAEKAGVKQPWANDPQVKRFYQEAAGGMMRNLYTTSGSVKDNEQSKERNAIETNPLWPKFRP